MKQVDVLMATYNGEEFLEEQLDSILNQTYTNWRLLIADDGSNDGTLKILYEYERKDSRIHVLDSPSFHSSKKNFFYLMSMSDAPLIMCCDQDDVWLEDKVEYAVKEIEKMNQNVPALCVSDLIVVDEKLETISDSFFKYTDYSKTWNPYSIFLSNVAVGCTMIFNQALCQKALEYKSDNDIYMHDWWLALVTSTFGNVVMMESPKILYRQHSHNVLGASSGKGMNYFLSQVSNIQHIRDNINRSKRQANLFFQTYVYDRGKNKSVFEFCEKLQKRKTRVGTYFFYKKYGIRKDNFIKNLAFYLLG